jgi:hypothetical protein
MSLAAILSRRRGRVNGGGGGGVTPTFFSDWRTGVGSTDAILTDNTKSLPWSGQSGGNGFPESRIFAISDYGIANWPVANAFVIHAIDDTPDRIASASIYRDLGTPSNGTDRYFRLYTAMLWSDSHGNGTAGNTEHGIETANHPTNGGAGAGGFVFYMVPTNTGKFWIGVMDEELNNIRFNTINATLLDKNKTYRIEWHLAYGATSYTVEVRVYDESGVLVLDTDDFVGYGDVDGLPLASYTYTGISLSRHRYFRVGTNGPGNNYPLTGIVVGDAFRAHGAVGVSEQTWCGPYSTLIGEAA